MGVFTYEFENSSVIAPARLFKSLILDADNLIPKVVPQAVKNTEIVSGNGGPGTIKKVHLGEGIYISLQYHIHIYKTFMHRLKTYNNYLRCL